MRGGELHTEPPTARFTYHILKEYEMAEEKSLNIEGLVARRDKQSQVISSIVSDVNNLQTALEQRQQQLQLNQGALLQLNLLLEELGVSSGTNDIGGEPVGDIPVINTDSTVVGDEMVYSDDVEVTVTQ